MAFLYPGNGIYIVQGEIASLISSMRMVHWSSRSFLEEENKPLLKNLSELKAILHQITDLKDIELTTFLDPFLEIIRSNETTVKVTVLALSSVNKFITYGIIGGVEENALLPVVQDIADTVSHANFITTDHPSDAVILMKIVEVLRTLVMSPLGLLLSNDSICEVMLSCFRICFEVHNEIGNAVGLGVVGGEELLRQNAEHCLKDIVQTLFQRLPLFNNCGADAALHYKKMRMQSKSVESNQKKKKKKHSQEKILNTFVNQSVQEKIAITNNEGVLDSNLTKNNTLLAEDIQIKVEDDYPESNTIISNVEIRNETSHSIALKNQQYTDNEDQNNSAQDESGSVNSSQNDDVREPVEGDNVKNNSAEIKSDDVYSKPDCSISVVIPYQKEENELIKSESKKLNNEVTEYIPLEPYNSVCVQELLRFLSLICNPYDKQNTDVMTHISLSLLIIALEVGADAISKHPTLLAVIKDTLCCNLLSLLQTDRMNIFAMNLHLSFLIFESMRSHLKFQLEYYLTRLTDIIALDSPKIAYEKKEMALEFILRLWRIPGLVTELFLNYDCDVYCPNLYEEITKLLSKNVYPLAGIHNTHLLSLDALLTVVESIEKHCHSLIATGKPVKYGLAVVGEQKECNEISNPDFYHNVPTHEQIMAITAKKKLLATGTDHFNANPKKGIQFLQEEGLLSTPLEPSEVATFLRENPHLDKKMIGEFISHRSNLQVLESFVKSFDFTNMRIDEALRIYLETFRLPGESPLISLVMQHFSDHWHKCNGEPFSKSDAAFVLSYASIMLNVDQHNQVVRRQQPPMTVDDFKKNLKGVDGGKDFDEELLNEIYQSIKNEEIVMPAEHTGVLRDNYLWKVLLRRGAGKDGEYVRARDGLYDHELFSICWGSVLTALGYVFDKSEDSSVYYKTVQGFRKCATISAHYGMSNEFDYLILSLSKFTMLLNPPENPEAFTISFGMNSKSRLAARTVFNLVHRHGDILKESWAPVFDCIFTLFRCKLLPKILVEAEDFLELSGKVSLIREDTITEKTNDTGLLSSIYSYIALATETSSQRINTDEEQECIEIAKTCVADCHLENLILESKFLRLESLYELLKALIKACYNSENMITITNKQEEDKITFFLELFLKVVIQNRDRVNSLWQTVCDHLNVLLHTSAKSGQPFLFERCVIGFLRLAIRLMRREEISSSVLQSLNTLLILKWDMLAPVCRQVAYGLHELLKTGAANIHSASDWSVIFTLLEVVGAGAPLIKVSNSNQSGGVSSDDTNTDGAAEDSGLGGDRPYLSGSDSSLNNMFSSNISSPSCSSLHLENREHDQMALRPIYCSQNFMPHDPFALAKCCESLAFLVRDVAHITPFNFENSIHCIRIFVEATFYTNKKKTVKKESSVAHKSVKKSSRNKKNKNQMKRTGSNPCDADESDAEEYPDSYYQVPMQLLDLMHTLHTRTAHIYRWWAEENPETEMPSLWPRGWCPLLQGISRFCCDPRKPIRMSAITYLQRALLVHDLQTLTADEWSSCFNEVLFPLLEKLLQPINSNDQSGMEETRMRAATLLSKVFLHHLTPLQSLPSFIILWLHILDIMESYMNLNKNSDLLNEAIQESIKNMILVIESSNLFNEEDASFWDITWNKINQFLPDLRVELFKYRTPPAPEVINQNDVQLCTSVGIQNSVQTELPCRDDVNFEEHESRKIESQAIHAGAENLEHSTPVNDVPLTKYSVPIFPYMGQLISTPIGPVTTPIRPVTTNKPSSVKIESSPRRNETIDNDYAMQNAYEIIDIESDIMMEQKEDAVDEYNNIINNNMTSIGSHVFPQHLHTQMSSLISSPDFLPYLPIINPQISTKITTITPPVTIETVNLHSDTSFTASSVPVGVLNNISPDTSKVSAFASSLPVYSGFSQLSSSATTTEKDNSSTQFFYRDLVSTD